MGCLCDCFLCDLVDDIVVMNDEQSPLLQYYTPIPNSEGCHQHTPTKGKKYCGTNCYGFAIHSCSSEYVQPSNINIAEIPIVVLDGIPSVDINTISLFVTAIKTDSERERRGNFVVEYLGGIECNPDFDIVAPDGSVDIIAGALQVGGNGNGFHATNHHWWRYINKPEIEQIPPQVGWYHKPGNTPIQNFYTDNNGSAFKPVTDLTNKDQRRFYECFLGYFKVTKTKKIKVE
jgi:hypothetical protein